MSSIRVSGKQEAKAFSPASVGNVGIGFDILGHVIEGAGDSVIARRIAEPTVRIKQIRGTTPDLPLDAPANTAGAALIALREDRKLDFGFEIEIEKGIPLGSGMGGSAASCVAALVAANELLDQPLTREQLYPYSLVGEAVASGGKHGDNLGPMLLGGLVLATADTLQKIPVPKAWHSLLVHPEAILETRRARAALKGAYELKEFVQQSANLSLFLAGCYNGDAALVRAGLNDVLVEPRRAPLIVGFDAAKRAMLDAGAMGASISGAGPSVFGWFETKAAAENAAAPVRKAFADAGFDSKAWVSQIDAPGAVVV